MAFSNFFLIDGYSSSILSSDIYFALPTNSRSGRAAILSKGIGAFLGSKLTGFSSKSALRIATGITPRAEILLVIAGIGLENEIFDENIFTVVILLVFVTVLLTPLMLQLVFKEKESKEEDTKSDKVQEDTKSDKVQEDTKSDKT